MLPSETIYPTFWRIFLSFSQVEHDEYLVCVDQATMPLPCLSPFTCPILPPLAARLSSPPPSMTPSSPTAVNSSTSDNNDMDKEEHAFPIPQDAAKHIQLPNGTHVLSSPTWVLPQPDTLCPAPAGPLTEYFLCHLLGHYCEECPSYTCPHCHLSTPGHPSSACPWDQCDFCHNWGHCDWFCPHCICGTCNTPGHIVDNCPVEHLSPSQLSVIFGGP